ncbi:MAG: hypothetical protein P3W87_000425 [Gammaproteobacteria bacterium]|nr:hypothetical protein [Gammaproteobacteria bacterium]
MARMKKLEEENGRLKKMYAQEKIKAEEACNLAARTASAAQDISSMIGDIPGRCSEGNDRNGKQPAR